MSRPARATRWTPAPFLVGSGALHLAVAVATALRPQWWPYTLGTVVADHVVLAVAGLWPRSTLLGPNWTRLPAAAAARNCIGITIDDGPEPSVTPGVLDVLDSFGVKATFFAIGERVERYPDLARDIVRRGHSLENHSYRHALDFSIFGPGRLRRDIDRAQQVIADTTGQRPLFFRAPAGLRNPLLDPVLSRLELHLASWTRRGFDTVSCEADTVLNRLGRNLHAGDILLLHDGHAARSKAGSPVILEVLPRLLAALSSARLNPITLREALR